jgi:hypothetical protein
MYEHSTYTGGPRPDANLRAGDADRQATEERLRRHHAEGRLDTDEFQERIDRCYQAKTVAELEQLVTDLPAPVTPSPRRVRVRRLWPIPLVPILIAVLAISATSGHHGRFSFWVLIPMLFLFRFLAWGRYRRWGAPWQHEHEM